MATLTIELPAQKNQTAFNLRRWSELLADSELGRDLAKVEGRIETDRHGHIIMYPPAHLPHGNYQSEIAYLLRTLLSNGRVATECPISTADGVKVADVTWISLPRLTAIGENICLTEAPEICVEVLSASNSRIEMNEKKSLCFAAGAQEVWFCDQKGKMTFFLDAACVGQASSVLCSQFPSRVEF
ncbi:MAG: Uma2 family endonuclease [Verrucomicrobiales bacterium]